MRTLESERLLLRPFAPDDFDALFAMHSHPEVTRWLPWGPRDRDEVRAVLEKKLHGSTLDEDGDALSFAVVLKPSKEVIGDGSLWLVSAEHRLGEVGYLFHPDHYGRGYATETTRLLLQLAFDEFRLHRVVGRLEPRNISSARVLEKVGMRLEAHFVENELIKGEWQSELVYAMLEREWRARG
jgi:RimJ/RimL family protein N-acetyltransferase